MRLRARFTTLFGLLAAATALALAFLTEGIVGRAVSERMAGRLERDLQHLADDLAGERAGDESRDEFLRAAALRLGYRVTLIASDGRVVVDTDYRPADVATIENHGNRPEVVEARRSGWGRAERVSATERRPLLYLARRVADGSVLRLAVPPERLRELSASEAWTLRLAVAAACLLLFLIGSAASRRYSDPIADLTRSASAVAAGDFARELPRSGGDEIQRLSSAMQRMKDSLNAALDRAEGERRLAAMVFETLPDGLVVVDAKLRVLESNRRFAEMTGVPAPAGRGVYELLREKPLFECFETTTRSGQVSERTVRLPEDRIWQITVVPVPEGHRAAVVGVLRDVSRLEKTEAMRRTFVGDVSHELRTPIASIAAAAETLAEGSPDKTETAELLTLIRRQSERMRELIDDLMDLAQIESGAVPLEREEIPLHELLCEVAEDLGAAARERRVDVRVIGDPSVTAVGDRRRIGQLARNLLDNAIKFSPEGAPVVVRTWQQAGRSGFSVEDLGPGIPKAERDKIFQRFYQVDRSRSKVRPGSGLGLAIVKHIAQLHGAYVEIEGDVGQGSTFHVRFPAVA
jgi:two-component system phosphate regulon sensor histidine kinase PhoR